MPAHPSICRSASTCGALARREARRRAIIPAVPWLFASSAVYFAAPVLLSALAAIRTGV